MDWSSVQSNLDFGESHINTIAHLYITPTLIYTLIDTSMYLHHQALLIMMNVRLLDLGMHVSMA